MRRISLAVLLSGLLAGCTTRTFSSTPRTAVEQLLLSAAVDRAMEKLTIPELANRKVFIDFTNLKCYDAEYVKVAVRTRIARQGATLVSSADGADYVVEGASGALAMEYKTGTVGLPSLPVPQSPIPFPALSLHKKIEQTAIIKLLVFVHRKGRYVASAQYYAKSERDESFVLWHRFHRADDVRAAWERAELKLKSQPGGAAGPK